MRTLEDSINLMLLMMMNLDENIMLLCLFVKPFKKAMLLTMG